MIDIAIPLGRFSKCADQEMKYALRSIEKNLDGWNRIFIIGYAPIFLNDNDRVIVVKKGDTSLSKQKNIFEKLVMACEDPEVSETFVATNDDIFFKEKTHVSELNYGYHSDLKYLYSIAEGLYKIAVKDTWNYLSQSGYQIKNFDIHTPIRYEKSKFLKLLELDWKRDMVIKSLYCNINRIAGTPARDLNFSRYFTTDQIHEALKDKTIFAVNGETGLNKAMLSALEEMFPKKSQFEK